MARTLRKPEDMGPAVPRWVVEFDPARWGDSDEGYGAWQHAVLDWADEHLGAWMDVCRGALWMRGADGA